MAKSALGAFERHVGSRKRIAGRIASNPLNPEEETFVALLLDPSRSEDSLGSLAVQAGIEPFRVLDLFRKGAVAEAGAISVDQIMDALPAINRDLLAHSVERREPCVCITNGKANKFCKTCGGTGVWIRDSEVARQQMVWEQAGLLKRGGLTIQQNQGISVQAGPTGWSMDKFVKNTDSTAYDVRPSDVIDVEPIKE